MPRHVGSLFCFDESCDAEPISVVGFFTDGHRSERNEVGRSLRPLGTSSSSHNIDCPSPSFDRGLNIHKGQSVQVCPPSLQFPTFERSKNHWTYANVDDNDNFKRQATDKQITQTTLTPSQPNQTWGSLLPPPRSKL